MATPGVAASSFRLKILEATLIPSSGFADRVRKGLICSRFGVALKPTTSTHHGGPEGLPVAVFAANSLLCRRLMLLQILSIYFYIYEHVCCAVVLCGASDGSGVPHQPTEAEVLGVWQCDGAQPSIVSARIQDANSRVPVSRTAFTQQHPPSAVSPRRLSGPSASK